eukprot:12813_1
MDDEFYNFHSLGNAESPNPQYPEPISMQPAYEEYQQLKSPANLLFDYYNNPNVSFSNKNFHNNNASDDDMLNDPNDPKIVMIRQINDDEKDWSEEDISDLETDAKNDTLPPPSIDTNINMSHKNMHNINNRFDPNEPHYVNVNDLINKIGFGKFHYQIIFLCGLGYIADSMWGEAVGLLLTPIQNEWDIDNAYLGWLAGTLFSGMCIGSFVWGRTSDIVGRKFPFTLTLTIGGVMGMILAFMISYNSLLLVLFLLGFGVGGNIPVDGAILAEFLPTSHRGSIMVSLSIFWAAGDLLSAFLGYLILPNRMCHEREGCKTEDNIGWRYFVFVLGAINCCFLFFRLGTNESPNFLICQGDGGRRRALSVLKRIAKTNNCPPNTVTNNMILQVDNPLLNRKLIKKLKNKQRLQHSLLNQQRENININSNSNRQQRLSSNPTSVKSSNKSSTYKSKSKTNSFESINLGSNNHLDVNNNNNYNNSRKSSLSVLSPQANNNNNNNNQFNNVDVNIDLNLEAHKMT